MDGNSSAKMSRKDFLKVSSIGLGGLVMGLKSPVAGAAEASSLPKEDKRNLYESWHSPWQPEIPRRLSDRTHELAWLGLSGEIGKTMGRVDWPCELDPGLTPQKKFAAAAKSVAENVPLRILPGELIVGSATLIEGAESRVPVLKEWGVNHTTFQFERILNIGYDGIREEIRERLASGTLDERGRDMNEAALITLDAADIWQKRNIGLLEQMRDGEETVEGRKFYQVIIDTLEQVPDRAPRSFREAVQSLWSMYCFNRLMGNWSGVGRIDKMLGPYLKEDLRKGVLTLDEAREILAHFWIKGTEWIGYHINSGDAQFYQNIILGGIDKDGREVTNEVTYLVLDIVEELHISDWPVAVRLGDKTPEKLFRRVAEVQRFGGGIVSVYSENVVIDALVKFGYPLDEAREFTNDGCWEAIIPGKTYFLYTPNDMVEVLGRTLHLYDGQDPAVDYPDFESLYSAFRANLHRDIDDLQGRFDHSHGNLDWLPNTLASIFVEGCLEKGRNYWTRGPKYIMEGIHYGGVSDTANSLLVLKKLVYEDKFLTLNEFLDILRSNWEGSEGLRRTIQNRFDFYGNDNAEADAMMCRVFDDYTAIVGEVKERDGIKRPCGISTFGREVDWRMKRRATPEGSRIGDILATNCSPTPGSDRKGPTSALNSYCKLDFTNSPSGATLELKILPSSVKGENGIKALVGLMKTFREKRGFYMHVDVVDTATLIDAQRHPEKYPNLPVRVSGWSARFTTLCKEWQDMIIQRTQQIC